MGPGVWQDQVGRWDVRAEWTWPSSTCEALGVGREEVEKS